MGKKDREAVGQQDELFSILAILLFCCIICIAICYLHNNYNHTNSDNVEVVDNVGKRFIQKIARYVDGGRLDNHTEITGGRVGRGSRLSMASKNSGIAGMANNDIDNADNHETWHKVILPVNARLFIDGHNLAHHLHQHFETGLKIALDSIEKHFMNPKHLILKNSTRLTHKEIKQQAMDLSATYPNVYIHIATDTKKQPSSAKHYKKARDDLLLCMLAEPTDYVCTNDKLRDFSDFSQIPKFIHYMFHNGIKVLEETVKPSSVFRYTQKPQYNVIRIKTIATDKPPTYSASIYKIPHLQLEYVSQSDASDPDISKPTPGNRSTIGNSSAVRPTKKKQPTVSNVEIMWNGEYVMVFTICSF